MPNSPEQFAAQPRCGVIKKNGRPCAGLAMKNGRCRVHGGPTPRGMASVHTRTGRYSKDLPTHLATRFEAALADPDLLAMTDEIALLDTRIGDLLSRADDGEAGPLLVRLRYQKQRMDRAHANKNHDAVSEAFDEIRRLIDQGATEAAAWAEITGLLALRATLAEKERKRLMDMQQWVSVREMLVLVSTLTGVLRQHITDQKILQAIAADMDRYIDLPPERRVDAEIINVAAARDAGQQHGGYGDEHPS